MQRRDWKKRFLILGPTGVQKATALANVQRYSETLGQTQSIRCADFEHDFVLPANEIEMHTYLDSDYRAQRAHWEKGWARFEKEVAPEDEIILSLHAVTTRNDYGVRSPVDVFSLANFKPQIIVTLIDDVYSSKCQTRARAGGFAHVGDPTLEQLVDARRHELLLGDLIAGHCQTSPKHVVLAVSHPARALHRLLFNSELRSVYLSFPISGPRKSKAKDPDDSAGIAEVNAFLQRVNEFEKINSRVVGFCPLTIDEKPLEKLLEDLPNPAPTDVPFSMTNRWQVSDFWGKEILLNSGIKQPDEVSLRVHELRDVVGMINADVRKRDYRLVEQAERLVVFNPLYEGKEPRGVSAEIACAAMRHIPVFIYQDPNHDPLNIARARFATDGGALGRPITQQLTTFVDTLDELLENIVK